MQVENRTFTKRFDINFALVILALNVIGLINLYSATNSASAAQMSRLFNQQLIWLCVGWGIFFFTTILDYKFFKRFAFVFYAINIVALVLVSFYGKKFYGAQRWLDLGFFRYQPSETMKLAMVLVMARVLSRYEAQNGLGIKELLVPLGLTAIPVLLTVKQPDLGTGILILAVCVSMIMFVGVRKPILIAAIVTGLVAAPVLWSFGLKKYQKNRILTFVDPGRDPRGTGYNSIQSKIAVGSGRILGKGFRKGTQSQLEFLPERHTDFIYSVLSEEHGFIGSVATFGLFLTLYWMALRIATQARDKFGALITVGVLAYLFWHVTVNIGMVIGLLPIVGVPLPLLSYGGSSMLATMAGLGLISGVAYRKYLF
ncbi:MAG: rod shape-determining protein RodA [Bdellovibrionaceae bacterium]|nr:rod shape-determining protein RodA [Pseudobdellovibrionaceae bacterium]